MTKLVDVLAIHEEICNKARSVIKTKGQDYNRGQQEKDTLFNMSVAPLLGIVDNVPQGILVRLSDKFMRLISLTKDPLENPAVTNESVRDTIEDTINYLVYLYIKYEEERKKAIPSLVDGEVHARNITNDKPFLESDNIPKQCGLNVSNINGRDNDTCWCNCGCIIQTKNTICAKCEENASN